MEVVTTFPSLAHYLNAIDASGTQALGARNASVDAGQWAGVALGTFVEQCRTLARDDFAARAQDIDAVADSLAGDLPLGPSPRRQPVWGRRGSSVSVHKVWRGDLGHAWRHTTRQQALTASQGALVLLVPSLVSASLSDAQIQWSAVATLALADYARRSGRRVEIWSAAWHVRVFEQGRYRGRSYVAMVPLVRAGTSWDSSAVVLATYPEWSRRLGFRALEQMQPTHGAFYYGYGHGIVAEAELLQWAREQWAPSQGLPPASVHLGCTQWAQVATREAACTWAQHHLGSLSAA